MKDEVRAGRGGRRGKHHLPPAQSEPTSDFCLQGGRREECDRRGSLQRDGGAEWGVGSVYRTCAKYSHRINWPFYSTLDAAVTTKPELHSCIYTSVNKKHPHFYSSLSPTFFSVSWGVNSIFLNFQDSAKHFKRPKTRPQQQQQTHIFPPLWK